LTAWKLQIDPIRSLRYFPILQAMPLSFSQFILENISLFLYIDNGLLYFSVANHDLLFFLGGYL